MKASFFRNFFIDPPLAGEVTVFPMENAAGRQEFLDCIRFRKGDLALFDEFLRFFIELGKGERR